jgi:hypothetical protein
MAFHDALGWSPTAVLALGAVALYLTGQRPVLRARIGRVAGAFTLAAIAALGVAIGFAVQDAHQSVDLRVDGRLPAIELILPWRALPVDPSLNHVTAVAGHVYAWGGTAIQPLDGDAGVDHGMYLPEAVTAVLPCGGSMVVEYGVGKIARYSRVTGQRISRVLQLPGPRTAWTCSRGMLSMIVAGITADSGLLVRLSLEGLQVLGGGPAQASRGPMIERFGQLVVADDQGPGHLRRWQGADGSELPLLSGYPEITELLPADNGALAVEAPRACLRQIDLDDLAARRGRALPGRPAAVATGHDMVMVLATDGRSIQPYDADRLMPRGAALRLPANAHAGELATTADGWIAMDATNHTTFTITAEAVIRASRITRAPAARPCV